MDSEVEALRREVRQLRAREIRQLLYHYARGVNRADAALIRSVYTAEGTDRHGLFDGPGEEFADVMADGAKRVWDCVGNHHITNILVELDGDDRARAEVYFIAFHPHADNGQAEMGIISGRYLDHLERPTAGGVSRAGWWSRTGPVTTSAARSGSAPASAAASSADGAGTRTCRTSSSASARCSAASRTAVRGPSPACRLRLGAARSSPL